MSESMNQETQTASTNEVIDATNWPKSGPIPPVETVKTTYNPGITTLEDKECPNCNQYKYVNVVIGILVLAIIGAFFLGGMVVENKMMKVQIEQLQRVLVK